MFQGKPENGRLNKVIFNFQLHFVTKFVLADKVFCKHLHLVISQLQDDVHVERVGGRMILPPIGDVHVVRLFGSGSESSDGLIDLVSNKVKVQTVTKGAVEYSLINNNK